MFISLTALLLSSTMLVYNGDTAMNKSVINATFTANNVDYSLPVGACFSLSLDQYYEDGDSYDYFLRIDNNQQLKFFSLTYHYDESLSSSYFLFHNYLQTNLYFGLIAHEVENDWYDVWSNDEYNSTFMQDIEYRIYGEYSDLTDWSVLNISFYFSAYDESTFDVLTSSDYQQGYAVGYQDGYTSGYNSGSADGFNEGQITGYNNGYNDGYTLGYTKGHNDGINEATPLQLNFLTLLGAIADTPVVIIRNLYSFDIFGTSALAIFMTLLTAIIVIHFVRKLI